jgi:hypothetical protein
MNWDKKIVLELKRHVTRQEMEKRVEAEGRGMLQLQGTRVD